MCIYYLLCDWTWSTVLFYQCRTGWASSPKWSSKLGKRCTNAKVSSDLDRSLPQSLKPIGDIYSSRFVIVTIFLPMRDSIGDSWSYLILFVAPVIASIIFLYFHLPETKHKSPIEVRFCSIECMFSQSFQNISIFIPNFQVEEAIAKLPTIFAIRSRGKVADEKSLKL